MVGPGRSQVLVKSSQVKSSQVKRSRSYTWWGHFEQWVALGPSASRQVEASPVSHRESEMLHVRTREGTFRKRGPGGRYPESAADRAPMPGLDHHSAAFSTVRSWVRYTSNGANPPYGWRVTSLIDVSQCAEALRTRPEPPRPRTARWRRTVTVGRGAARQHGGAGPWGICPGIMTRCVTFPQWPYVLGARYVLPAGREPGRRGHAVYTLLRCARAGGLERWSSRLATVVSDGGGVGVFGRHTDHRGRHTVEDTLWKTRCGRRAVEDALWKTRCGRRAVEDAPTQGPATVAAGVDELSA